MAIESVAAFVELLRESRLLEPAQMAEVRDGMQSRCPDAKSLARELVQRNWLTAYQANQLLLGRGQELVLGQYVLLERLGEGGMGQVFKARHQKLGRIVAVKIIRKERLDHPEIVRRFRREIQAAAQLDHANIVHAFDADEAEGIHFFAMEYVEGTDLARLVKQRGPLPVREACDYIRQAALGLQHAHERGLVHRDIKPSNLLLSVVRAAEGHGRRTTGHGQIKLLDMGLARLQTPVSTGDSASSLTQQGTIMGTPDYIAPEQAMSSHTVDIRADIYSLGCTLFFLLTGKAPFPGGTIMDKLVKHQTEEAPDLEQRRPDVPPGVAAIVRKLLAKRPADRYQTPADLAAVLAPFAGVEAPVGVAVKTPVPGDGEPATPFTPTPTPVAAALRDTASELGTTVPPLPQVARIPRGDERWPWWPIVLGIGSVFLIGVLVLSVALMSGKRDRAESSGPVEERPKTPVVTVHVVANQPWQDTGIDAQVNMPIILRAKGQWKMGPSAKECSADGDTTTSIERNVLPEATAMCLIGRIGTADAAYALGKDWTFYPKISGRLFVQANDLDLEDNSGTLTLEVQTDKKGSPATPPPPTMIQTAEVALRKLGEKVSSSRGEIEPLRQELFAFRTKFAGTPQSGRAAELLTKLPSPLDKLAATRIPEDARESWRAAEWAPPKELVAVLGEHRGRHWGTVTHLGFTRDGKRILSAGGDSTARCWDGRTLQEQNAVPYEHQSISAFAFSPDGKLAATASGGAGGAGPGLIRIWDAARQRERAVLREDGNGVIYSLSFSPDGRRLLSGSYSGSGRQVQLWDVETGALLHFFQGHRTSAYSVAFSPDGRRGLSGSEDHSVRIWDLETGKELHCFEGHTGPVSSVMFSSDGRRAMSRSHDQTVRLWDLVQLKQLAVIDLTGEQIWSAVLAPDGMSVATACASGRGSLWDVGGATAKERKLTESGAASVLFSPDGKTLAMGTTGQGVIRLWDLRQPEPVERHVLKGHTATVRLMAFAPDGRTLVSSGDENVLRLWDVETGKLLHPVVGHAVPATKVVFAPDGMTLATAGPQALKLWDVLAGKEQRAISLHTEDSGVAFSADGKYLAARDNGNHLGIWDVATGEKRHRLGGGPLSVDFSPDSQTLASAQGSGGTNLWDVAKGELRLNLESPNTFCAVFSPTGQAVATGNNDNTIRLYDPATGRELRRFEGFGSAPRVVAFSPDGRYIAGSGGELKVWDLITGKERYTLPAVAFAFSHDGNTIATTIGDGVALYRASTGERYHVWHLPGGVSGLAFAPDGRHLATGNVNGTVYLFRVPPPPTSAAAETALNTLMAKASDPKTDANQLRQELREFRVRYGTFPQALRVPELLKKLPSPLDELNPAQIPADARESWRVAEYTPPEELVAVVGEHRRRHWRGVGRLACSPDGKLIASVSGDVIHLWDATTYQETAVLRGHREGIACLAFSPDSKTLASGSVDDTIRLWDVAGEPKPLPSPKTPSVDHHALAFAPDGRTLASGSSDKLIRLWDLTGKEPKNTATLQGHGDAVTGLTFTRDGQTLISASNDKTVRLWDVAAAKERASFQTSQEIDFLSLSPDGKTLATGYGWRNPALQIWDVPAGTERLRLKAQEEHTFFSAAFSPDSKTLVTGGGWHTGLVKLWDLATGKERASFRGHGTVIHAVAFAADGKTVICAGGNGVLRLWDVEAEKEFQPLVGHTCHVQTLSFSPDDRMLATGSTDGTARLWELIGKGFREQAVIPGHDQGVYAMVFSPEGETLVTGGAKEPIRLWKLGTTEPREWAALRGPTLGLTGTGDGQLLASHHSDGGPAVYLWDAWQPRQRRGLPHPSNVYAVALTPDGKTLAAGCLEKTIHIWDLSGAEPVERAVLEGHSQRVISVALTPDGKTLASRSNEVFLWDLTVTPPTRRTIAEPPHMSQMDALVFSPDGRVLAAPGDDGRVVLWDTASGKKLRDWRLPGPVFKVAFSSDGRYLATANGNGTAYIFRLVSDRRLR